MSVLTSTGSTTEQYPFYLFKNQTSDGTSIVFQPSNTGSYVLYLAGEFDGATLTLEWSIDSRITWYPYMPDGVSNAYTSPQDIYINQLSKSYNVAPLDIRMILSGAGTNTNVTAQLR